MNTTKARPSLTTLAEEFETLAGQMKELSARSAYIRGMLRKHSPGKYASFTVYRVKSHQVKSYWREGYTAVRHANNP